MKFFQNVAFSESEHLIEVAKIAEELGFFGLATADHLITPATINSTYPYAPDGKAWWDPNTHFPETWSMYSVLAQHTTNLHFMPTIYIVPMRDPFTLAERPVEPDEGLILVAKRRVDRGHDCRRHVLVPRQLFQLVNYLQRLAPLARERVSACELRRFVGAVA